MNYVIIINTLVYCGIYLLSLLFISKIFKIDLIVAIIKGSKFEFRKKSGFVSFAGFLFPFLFLMHKDVLAVIKDILMAVPPDPKLESSQNIPLPLIIVAFSFLLLDFLMLYIFNSQENP